jgi:hypothetical protein
MEEQSRKQKAAILETTATSSESQSAKEEKIAIAGRPGKDLKARSIENLVKFLSQKDASLGSSKIKQKLHLPGNAKGW